MLRQSTTLCALLVSLAGLLGATDAARATSLAISGPGAAVAPLTSFRVRLAYNLDPGVYDQIKIAAPSFPGANVTILANSFPAQFTTVCNGTGCTWTATNYTAVGASASGEILVDLRFQYWSVPDGTTRTWNATMETSQGGVVTGTYPSGDQTVTVAAQVKLFFQDLGPLSGFPSTWYTAPANNPYDIPAGTSGVIIRYDVRVRNDGPGWLDADTRVTVTMPAGLYVVSAFASGDNGGLPYMYRANAQSPTDPDIILPNENDWMTPGSLAAYAAANATSGRLSASVYDIESRPSAWTNGNVVGVFHPALRGTATETQGSVYTGHLHFDVFVPCDKGGANFPSPGIQVHVAATEVTATGTIARAIDGTMSNGTAINMCTTVNGFGKSGPATGGAGQFISWGFSASTPRTSGTQNAILVDRVPEWLVPPYDLTFNGLSAASPGARFARYLCNLPGLAAGAEDMTYDDFLAAVSGGLCVAYTDLWHDVDALNSVLATELPPGWSRITHWIAVGADPTTDLPTGLWGSSVAGARDLAMGFSGYIDPAIMTDTIHNDAFFHATQGETTYGTFGIQWNAAQTAWNEAGDIWDRRVDTAVITTSGPRFMDQTVLPVGGILPRGNVGALTTGRFTIRVGSDGLRPVPVNPSYKIDIVDSNPNDGLNPRDGVDISTFTVSYVAPEIPTVPSIPVAPFSWPFLFSFSDVDGTFTGFDNYYMTFVVNFTIDPTYAWVDQQPLVFQLSTSAANARPAIDNPSDEMQVTFSMSVPGEQRVAVTSECLYDHAPAFRVTSRNTGGRVLDQATSTFTVPAGYTLAETIDVSVGAAGGTLTLLDANDAVTTNLALARKVRADLGSFPALAADRVFIAHLAGPTGVDVTAGAVMNSASGLTPADATGTFATGSCLTITKYFDADGDGVRDADEPGIGGWHYTVTTGASSREVVTSADGTVSFPVASGTYAIDEILHTQDEGQWRITEPVAQRYTQIVMPSPSGYAVFGNACSCAANVNHDANVCTIAYCLPTGACADGLMDATHPALGVDDHDVCTADTCDPTTGAVHTPVSISDSNVCTADACDPVTGISHTAIATNDSNACTTDTCDPVTGVSHTPVAIGDNNVCTADACDPVTGVSHTPVAITDNNACTTDACDPVTGVSHTAVVLTDNNVCTADACDAATGVRHTPVAISDNNVCTADACDPVTGVSHTPISPSDDDVCTTDTCDPETGPVHTPISSSDNDLCTTDSCDPVTGVHHESVAPAELDDANACTQDGCDPTSGPTHTPIAVDDSDVCTVDACDPASGPTHTPVSVDDGNLCTSDACDPTSGPSHTPVGVDDKNACTVDACAPATGVSHTPVALDDQNACTADSCDPKTGAVHTPVAVDDQNACTVDSCDPKTGVAHAPVTLDDHDACTVDSCDPATGIVRQAVVCDDKNACTTDACDHATGCTTTPVACNDANACTTDSCNPATGCAHAVIDCEDENACTRDSCDPEVGCAHATVSCDDGDVCTGDSCEAATGCAHVPVMCEGADPCRVLADGVPCDAGLCALAGACEAGHCHATKIASCDDGDPCTRDACDPATGCTAERVEDGTTCNDNDGCTSADTCHAGVCGGTAETCGAPASCEGEGACNPATGVCDYPIDAACAACDGDRVAPIIVCPAPVVGVECTHGGTLVTLGQASARDACSAATVTSDAPATFARGITVVTFTALDAAGNQARCTTTVEVVDTKPPTLTCPEVTTVQGDRATCGAKASVAVVASDACDGSELTLIGPGAAAEAVFGPGTTDVYLTAVDAAGNQASCQSKVAVTGLDHFTLSCDADVTFTAPADTCGWPEPVNATASDECVGTVDVQSEVPAFPIGVTTVDFAATRGGDGATASCTTRVTVLDTTPPTIDCGAPLLDKADLAASFVPSAADACGAELVVTGAGCVRIVGETKTPVSERCAVTIENGSWVRVTDAPASADGAVFVTYSVAATDPSGNRTTIGCLAPVDPESLDHDGDTIVDRNDNCPDIQNTTQEDVDRDRLGDACDPAPYDGLAALGSGGCAGAGSPPELPMLVALMGLWLLRRRY